MSPWPATGPAARGHSWGHLFGEPEVGRVWPPYGSDFNSNEQRRITGVHGSTPEYREIGDRLRTARTARHLSLRALAERLGVSPSLISQVERGLAKPSVNTLYAMAR